MASTSSPARRAWVPALLWLTVIAWESTPLASFQQTGGLLRPIVMFFAPHITEAQFVLVHGVLRKAGHFFGYGILSVLMLRAWWATLALPRGLPHLPSWREMMRWWSGRAAVIAFFSSALVSVLDEWHQAHLPGRTGTIQDVLLDSSAAVCAQLFLVAISECQALARDKQLMIPDECFSKLPPA